MAMGPAPKITKCCGSVVREKISLLVIMEMFLRQSICGGAGEEPVAITHDFADILLLI